MKHYQQLNKEERFYIWNALRTGSTQKEVAIALKRSPSTICREIKRNKIKSAKIYTYCNALDILRRRQNRVAKTKHRKLNKDNSEMIELLLRQYLSPEQVSGYLAKHHDISISHETIYRYIYSDKERHKTFKPFMRHYFWGHVT